MSSEITISLCQSLMTQFIEINSILFTYFRIEPKFEVSLNKVKTESETKSLLNPILYSSYFSDKIKDRLPKPKAKIKSEVKEEKKKNKAF